MATFSLRLPEDQLQLLREVAVSEGLTPSDIVRRAIRRELLLIIPARDAISGYQFPDPVVMPPARHKLLGFRLMRKP